MAIKAYLQLVRLPNVFTAAADSLAGWLLVRGSFAEPDRWGPLVAASMAIYAAGIALNDYFDVELDRSERPNRPLPSGQVSRRFALGLSVGLFGLGLALAALSGSTASLAVAASLVACVVLYDAGLRRTILGPEVMGACRGLNLLLGMSQASQLGGPMGWLTAGSLGLFVVGLTWISRSETYSGRIKGIVAGLVLQDLALLGLLVAAFSAQRFPNPESRPEILPLAGLGVLLITALVVQAAVSRAVREPVPGRIQNAVKTSVFSLIWLNVGIVAAVRGPWPALAVAALWIPAYISGRWLYST